MVQLAPSVPLGISSAAVQAITLIHGPELKLCRTDDSKSGKIKVIIGRHASPTPESRADQLKRAFGARRHQPCN